jgi:hypothetical protein
MTNIYSKAVMLTGAALCVMATASCQPQPSTFVSEYSLVSSTTSPIGSWRFSKGRLSVKQLDRRHYLFVIACEWTALPAAGCYQWWTAQERDGLLYMSSMNSNRSVRFDPATRRLTLTMDKMDSENTVRIDEFVQEDAPLTDKGLIAAMKEANESFQMAYKHPDLGHYSNWAHTGTSLEIKPQGRAQ